MQIQKNLKNTVILGLAVAAIGLSGCAGHPNRSFSTYWKDHKTSDRVQDALTRSPTYKFPDVRVTTFDHVVQLSGFVNVPEQKQAAVEIAKNVQGVQGVIDNISLVPTPTGRVIPTQRGQNSSNTGPNTWPNAK